MAFEIVFGCLWMMVLEAFGDEELLAISIPTLVPLVFLLTRACSCFCNDEIKSGHAHNMHTKGGGGDSM